MHALMNVFMHVYVTVCVLHCTSRLSLTQCPCALEH